MFCAVELDGHERRFAFSGDRPLHRNSIPHRLHNACPSSETGK
jgi:hypothetical protein